MLSPSDLATLHTACEAAARSFGLPAEEEAEAVAVALATAWEARGAWSGRGTWGTFVQGVARNAIRDWLRAERRRQSREGAMLAGAASAGPDPCALAVAREVARTALLRLSPARREVLALTAAGWSDGELARAWGVTPSAVRQRRFAARRAAAG